ncbi:MAG: DEAD/DEAH box helicase family protein [Verrucomicrobiaceae bacterium]|nr:DEAD/DEAH box helicase family protein [Verrucomicrobiaceae bacterium]
MSDRYGHKTYQNEVLETLRQYWRACRESGDPETAFMQVTEKMHGISHPYNKVQRLENGTEMPQDMPFVCLRVPTGGGKTVIGARAIRVFKDELLNEEKPLVLWLVPSEAIKTQTVKQMKDLSHPIRRILEEELGEVEIFDGPEALGIQPSIIAGKATVIVSTIQAYRVEVTDGRKVYGNNGQLMGHFDHIPLELKNSFPQGFPHSLANVLRMHRPLVVVDEAHNARSELSLQVLERFQPRAIVELTATPITDAKDTPSNVLHSVSAMQLKAEKMIKLPVVLVAESGFKEVVAAAIAMRGDLEKEAEMERNETGEYIRPILLFQGEPHSKERETLTVEVIEKALREEHYIPEAQIVVHTGDEKGLKGLDLNAESCAVRYVVTQSALKEGWDCPFAYVLCSVANLSSTTAVEQMLGRVLRMPNAKEKKREALNKAYAFVRSPHFYLAANLLRDQLVKKSGYDKKEAREFFVQRGKQSAFDLEAGGQRSVTVNLPEGLSVEALPAAMQKHVLKYDGTRQVITLTGKPDSKALKILQSAVQSEEAKELIKAAVDQLATQETIMTSPAERQERFAVPQMMLELGGKVISTDEGSWLETEWRPPLPPKTDDVPTLADAKAEENAGIIDVEGDKVITRRLPELGAQLRLIEVRENWSEVKLVSWLDRNIPHDDLEADVARAWFNAVINEVQKQVPLGRLVRERFELRRKLEARLATLRKEARRGEYQMALFGQHSLVKLRVGCGYEFVYDPNSYPAKSVCPRSSEFVKHYYEKVGELECETEKGTIKEEFLCAQFIDGLPEVKWWVRNLDKQEAHSFWLQTSTDRFYPDFVIQLHNGRVLVVEYKGKDRSTNDDSEEKELLGKLWADHSEERCLFLMVSGLNEFDKINASVK